MTDFSFAFNDKDFSDRVLHVEIVADSSASYCDSNTSRKRKNLKKSRGDDVHSSNPQCSTDVEVDTLHINSAILAAKSPFFQKLFKNGMRESIEKDVRIRIDVSEKTALMGLLEFMYKNTLTATSTTDLMNVLMVADKFEVTSCMKYCIELLETMDMKLNAAITCIELPSSALMDEIGFSLKEEAKQYLIKTFTDLSMCKEVAMGLPLSALEVVLEGDQMTAMSEDKVYYFILAWARVHYPNLQERQEILTKHLLHFIYFPFLPMSTLKDILVCPDFNSKEVTNLVLESLYLNSGNPYGNQHIRLSGDPAVARSHRRSYNSAHIPSKVFEYESPKPRCVVYFYLSKEDCSSLFGWERALCSEMFWLDREAFYLEVKCVRDDKYANHLSLYVHKLEETYSTLSVEFAVMDEDSSHEFRMLYRIDNCVMNKNQGVGSDDVFGIPWYTLTANQNNGYFINDFLHLRADITLTSSHG